MPGLTRLLTLMLVGLVASGCSMPDPGAERRGCAALPGIQPPEGTYVLDFTCSDGGGLNRGRWVNLAFSIDMEQPLRKLAFSNMTHQSAPGFVAGSDRQGCNEGVESLMEHSVRDLLSGDPASLDYVDIEMIPRPHDTPEYQGGACFGYREPGGPWRWNFEMTPVTYDTATDKLTARVPIQQAPVDAVKIIFGYEDEMHVLTTLAFAAKPHPAP